MFLRIIECLLALFFLTQVVLPLCMGKKTFPLFRKEGELLSEISSKHQKEIEDALEAELHPPKHEHEQETNAKQ